jgi:hypothetical protein
MENELIKDLAELNDKYLEVKAENERLKGELAYYKWLIQVNGSPPPPKDRLIKEGENPPKPKSYKK